MVRSFWTPALATIFAAVSASLAQRADSHPYPNIIPRPLVPFINADHLNLTDVNGVPMPPLDTIYHFDQLVDHQNPQLGTFKQRFWMTWEFYIPGGYSRGDAVESSLIVYIVLCRRAHRALLAWRDQC